MKRLSITLGLIVFLSAVGFAQQKDMGQKKQQMMEMMQDSSMRVMMMEHIANNPDMRKQMVQGMMQNMPTDSIAMMNRMQRMMNDPEIHKRMEQHIAMMQSMMESGHMKHGQMMGEMGDDSMMKMHMMCMQMMQNHTDMMKDNGMKQ